MKILQYLLFIIAVTSLSISLSSCKSKKVLQDTELSTLDEDGDGVEDSLDDCLGLAGPPENNGCPWEDKDGDGILDKDDECPETAGSSLNNGCPEVTEEVQKSLNDFAKVILFDSGKATIKNESIVTLRSIVVILNAYPNAKFEIAGHTDSSGNSESNQRLSEARANAVKNYLTSNGVSAGRLTAKGYGESMPIVSNSTPEGQAQNRRTEINLIKE